MKYEDIVYKIEKTNEGLEAKESFKKILKFIGEDPEREGLKETPKRFLKYLLEATNQEDFNFTTFSAEGYNEMIIVKDIIFYSFCEHHIAPIIGKATVAYIPNDKIVGLSKIPRTVKYVAANLQNQERITSQIAEMLEQKLQPKGVAVMINARHMCMEMRGVKSTNSDTTTTKLTGVFMEDAQVRNEFLNSIN